MKALAVHYLGSPSALAMSRCPDCPFADAARTREELGMRCSSMITAVDAHACGEPGRVITGGVLDVPGRTMFDKKTYLETKADGLRLRMLREPCGYPAANCNLILPSNHPEADAGFVIMEQMEYP